jgi:hypothetical protein
MCLIFPDWLATEGTGFSPSKEAKTPAKIEELRFTYRNIGDSQPARTRR